MNFQQQIDIQKKQFTRKDIDLDDDDYGINQQAMTSLDFLDIPPKLSSSSRKLSGSEGSQASSTVIHSIHRSESRLTKENLNSLVVDTLNTEDIYNQKLIDNQRRAKINQQDGKYQPGHNELEIYYNLSHTDTDKVNTNPEEDAFHDEEYDDNLNDYLDGMLASPPASPPRELDPNKLYALYDFNGPDPSHLELFKDDSVELLNDSDSYWWLVRKVINSDVGFAPAEILETFEERLARLNCWKNEVIERNDVTALSTDDMKTFQTNSRKKYSEVSLPYGINNSSYIMNQTSSNISMNAVDGADESLNVRESNSSLMLLERKSSLKRSKSSIRKTVSFAPNAGTLPDLSEDEDSKSAVDSETYGADQKLTINKRISNSNFLVKNLDDYNERFASYSDNEEDKGNYDFNDYNDDEEEDEENADLNAGKMEHIGIHRSVGPVTHDFHQPPNAQFMSTVDSIGSYSPSTISDSEFIDQGPEIDQVVATHEEAEEQNNTTLQSEASSSSSIQMTPSSHTIETPVITPGSGGKLQNSGFQSTSFQEKRNQFLEGQKKRQNSKSSSIKMLDELMNGKLEFKQGIEDDDDDQDDEAIMNDQKDNSMLSTSSTISSSSTSAVAQHGTTATNRGANLFGKSITTSSLETTTESLVSSTMPTSTTKKQNNAMLLSNPKLRATKNQESIISMGKTSRNSSSSLNQMENLHPVTNELFNPLYSQLDELEKMLNDIVLN